MLRVSFTLYLSFVLSSNSSDDGLERGGMRQVHVEFRLPELHGPFFKDVR